jgi:creatinine amidohydrolase
MEYKLHHKSWKKIDEEVRDQDTIIIPLGSLEAHGTDKPVGSCFLLADSASNDVGKRTGIPVTPIIPFGVSESYQNFPGTISVSMKTLSNYVYEVSKSLIKNGFKKIVFFSAHGGNNLPVLRELSFKLRDEYGALCTVIHVWGMISKLTPTGFWEKNLRTGHGGEPTSSVMLYLYPDLFNVKESKSPNIKHFNEDLETGSYSSHKYKDIAQNIFLFAEEVEDLGYMGDSTKASAEKGKILYEKTIDYLADYINFFSQLKPS